MGTCNNCLAIVPQRVEILNGTSREVVCGACALAIAASNPRVEIRAFEARQISQWVTSDGNYYRQESDATARQRDLDAKGARYAERVRNLVARRLEFVAEAA